MRKINNFLIILLFILSLFFTFNNNNFITFQRLLPSLSIILVLYIPRIFNKLFKFQINSQLELIYIIFIFLAQFLGSVIDFYNHIWWWDLFIHFLSGMLTAIFALDIMKWSDVFKEDKQCFNLLFMNCFTLMVASLWEFVEFGSFVFLSMDVQHHLTTGVFDTMEDMLIAFLGNIIICGLYLLKNNKKKKR